MNQEHKDLLIAAAKAIFLEYRIEPRWGALLIKNLAEYKDNDEREWNPITSLSDRYDLARRCKLTIDFETGEVWQKGIPYDVDSDYRFTPNDDESEALVILRAAVASGWESE